MPFVCIYVPNFRLQSVVRVEPALGDSAIALIDEPTLLGNVMAANPAALQAGIQLGMTKSQAAEFCGVQIRQRSEIQEKAAHAALLDVAWSISPRVEDSAADTIVADLEGLGSLWGSTENIAEQIAKRVTRIGLAPQIAVASQIEMAIPAARGLPGISVLPEREEVQRLADLPVHVLSTNQEILETFESWGVNTLRALAALPILQLSTRLGQEGVRLHQLASGTYLRALVLAESSSRFEEEMELEDSVDDLEPLSFLLGRLLHQLCARLETRALAVQAIYVQFELEPSFEKDFQTATGELRKKVATKQYVKVMTLPVAMRDPQMLLKLLRLQLQADPPKAPIQKMMLRVEPAGTRVAQGGLFAPCTPDPEKLELTLARLAKLVGDGNVGSAELLDTYRPGSFQMKRFQEPGNNAKYIAEESSSQPVDKSSPTMGFRMIRPAAPLTVELRAQLPTRVCLHGEYGEVVAASGPWRTSGDWWQENSWHQDEWDLAIDFGNSTDSREGHKKRQRQGGVYRIYYDAIRQSWFARGFYD